MHSDMRVYSCTAQQTTCSRSPSQYTVSIERAGGPASRDHQPWCHLQQCPGQWSDADTVILPHHFCSHEWENTVHQWEGGDDSDHCNYSFVSKRGSVPGRWPAARLFLLRKLLPVFNLPPVQQQQWHWCGSWAADHHLPSQTSSVAYCSACSPAVTCVYIHLSQSTKGDKLTSLPQSHAILLSLLTREGIV